MNFCPPAPRRRRAVGWEAARPCVSNPAKPAKIGPLIVCQLVDCGRPLKNVSIFAGFARCQAASRWAGSAPVRAQIVAQSGFERRLVIATQNKTQLMAGFLIFLHKIKNILEDSRD